MAIRSSDTAHGVVTAFSLMMEEPDLPAQVALTAINEGISLPPGLRLEGGVEELLRLAMVGHRAENT